MSKLNGIEYEVGIRQYPKIMSDLNKYKSHFDKLRYLIVLSKGIKKKAEKGIEKPGSKFNVLSIYSIHLFENASNPTQSGLEIFQNDFNLLIAASDVSRASGDRKKSLEYAELLITHHPDHWNGYVRLAQDLIALKRSEEAQVVLQTGLDRLPNQKNLLLSASGVYRALGDREKSLKYAELLITHHPDHWNGYVRSAQDLIALKRSEEAQAILQTGLNKFPNQKKLQKISEQHYRN